MNVVVRVMCIVVLVLLGFGMVVGVPASNYATVGTVQMVVRESESFHYSPGKQKMQSVSAESMPDYLFYYVQGDTRMLLPFDDSLRAWVGKPVALEQGKLRLADGAAQSVVPEKTQGNYSVQIVLVSVVPPGVSGLKNDDPQRFIEYDIARSVMFGVIHSVKSFIDDASDGELRLTGHPSGGGDVISVTIQTPIDNCNARMLNEFPQLIDAQLPEGRKIAQTHTSVLVFKQDVYGPGKCTERGVATVAPVRLNQLGNMIWVSQNHYLNDLRVTVHEFGHNLGLDHSSSALYNPATSPLTWTRLEYGDPVCVMGGSGLFRLNSAQAHRLGWARKNAPFREIAYPGTYSLYSPALIVSRGAKSSMAFQNSYIKAQADTGQGYFLYPEARRHLPPHDDLGMLVHEDICKGLMWRWGSENLTGPAYKTVAVHMGTQDGNPLHAPLVIKDQPIIVFNVTATLKEYQTPMRGLIAQFNF